MLTPMLVALAVAPQSVNLKTYELETNPALTSAEKAIACDPMDSGLPSVAVLHSGGSLSLVVGPDGYSLTKTVASSVADFAVVWGESDAIQDGLIVVRSGNVVWYTWNQGSFDTDPVNGLWTSPALVAARGPAIGAFGLLAVYDTVNGIYPCFLVQNSVFIYHAPIPMNGATVHDMAIVDIDGDGASEIAVQTDTEIRFFNFQGQSVGSHHQIDADSATLGVVTDSASDRLVSLSESGGIDSLSLVEATSMHTLSLGAVNTTGLVIADMDANHKQDAVVCGSSSRVYFMQSAGFTSALSAAIPFIDQSSAVAALDMDHDQDMDLVGFKGTSLSVVENNALSYTRPSGLRGDFWFASSQDWGFITMIERAGDFLGERLKVTFWCRNDATSDVDTAPVWSQEITMHSEPYFLAIDGPAGAQPPSGSEIIFEVRPVVTGEEALGSSIGLFAGPFPTYTMAGAPKAAQPPLTTPIRYVPPFPPDGAPTIP